jgi:hypothetical protein
MGRDDRQVDVKSAVTTTIRSANLHDRPMAAKREGRERPCRVKLSSRGAGTIPLILLIPRFSSLNRQKLSPFREAGIFSRIFDIARLIAGVARRRYAQSVCSLFFSPIAGNSLPGDRFRWTARTTTKSARAPAVPWGRRRPTVCSPFSADNPRFEGRDLGEIHRCPIVF